MADHPLRPVTDYDVGSGSSHHDLLISQNLSLDPHRDIEPLAVSSVHYFNANWLALVLLRWKDVIFYANLLSNIDKLFL